MSDADRDNPRREFLRKSLTLIPVVTLAGTGLGSSVLQAAPQASPATPAAAPAKTEASAYQPSYFTAEEWAFINAAVAHLIP
ncbi:gluconate 2-dehydrogenase, partial [Pseudomonas sp. HMWF021]